ncbi:MAG: C4-type zinc ribbon domain-containing protein [Verrucomicrobiota bacterium]|nr:C4-type zinc ribbon domain-containing protein [Verrucomicrobiota bacterium]
MADWIDTLLNVQEIDKEIDRMEEEMKTIPQKKKGAETLLEDTANALSEAKNAVQNIEMDIKKIEMDIDKMNGRMAKLQTQTLDIKDNKEYKAMINEINHAKDAISDLEDQELLLMEKLEEAKNAHQEAKSDFDKKNKDISQMKKEFDIKLKEDEVNLVKQREVRSNVAKSVPGNPLEIYNRLRTTRKAKDCALAKVLDNGMCEHCRMKVTPQTHNYARKKGVVTCDNCGVLIYTD